MKNNKTKGITLIALILTIIIMLILASVTINIVINGEIFQTVKTAKEKQEMAKDLENLELVKALLKIESYQNEGMELKDYFNKLEQEGIIESKDDVIDNGDGTYEITTKDDNVFEISKDEDGEIKIEYIGKTESTLPKITAIPVTKKTTNSIEIAVEARRAEGATYTYAYRENGTDEWQTPEEAQVNGNKCKFTNLKEQTIYEIKVEVETKNGKAEKTINEVTGELPTGTIEFTNPIWKNGTAKVTVTNTEAKYQMQYQVNGITEELWTNIENVKEINGLNNGDTVYARIWDGTNGTKPASASINDLTPPEIKTFTATAHDTKSITVSVEAADNETGIKSYEFQYKEAGASIYTTATTTTTSNNTCTYQYENLKDGTTYNLVVVVTDKADKQTTSAELNQATEVAVKPQVGDYVDYSPAGTAYETSYNVEAKYSGRSSDQTVYLQEAKWRINDIKADGTVELISENSLKIGSTAGNTTNLYFYGANGYNNGVELLNELCNNLYGTGRGAKGARSLNIEDIQDKMNTSVWNWEDYEDNWNRDMKWGESYEYTTKKTYPIRYAEEEIADIRETKGISTPAGTLKQSDNGILIANTETTSKTAGYSINAKHTYWRNTMSADNFKNPIYYSLYINNGSNMDYWLASRAVGADDAVAYFCLSRVSDGQVREAAIMLSDSPGDSGIKFELSVRPLVLLEPTVTLTLDVGATTDDVTTWTY